MRGLQRRFAHCTWIETTPDDRLSALKKGLENLNQMLEKLETKMDRQSQEFGSIITGLDDLSTKIDNIAETKCHIKLVQEIDSTRHGKYTPVRLPIQRYTFQIPGR